MRSLLFSSLIAFCFCTGLHAQVFDLTTGITVFTDTTQRYLYKNKIDLYGHYFSGLMMIKPLGKGDYKVAITTEFGSKILDFEFRNGDFLLNDCIDEMRRKKVLKILESDMRLLLGIGGRDCRSVENENNVVIYLKCQKRRLFKRYLIDMDAGFVSKMFAGKKKKTDVEISLTDYNDGRPGNIDLKHIKIPVSIQMSLL